MVGALQDHASERPFGAFAVYCGTLWNFLAKDLKVVACTQSLLAYGAFVETNSSLNDPYDITSMISYLLQLRNHSAM